MSIHYHTEKAKYIILLLRSLQLSISQFLKDHEILQALTILLE
jgi:hypothetical protein